MSNPILLNNEPHDIATNDLLGTRSKAKAIQDFLESYHDRLGNNKMFALYGEWGSGKSSLLQYLDKHLTSTKFETIFFETWQNEKDENLPLSLAYTLAERGLTKRKNKAVSEFKQAAGVFLKCFLKGVTVKIGSEHAGIDLSLKDAIEAHEQEKVRTEVQQSFSERLDRFKSAFEKLEDAILGKGTDKRLIVFIDDLDRCETENILTLIGAIKLFFTYGKRTLFFCGVDKSAVMNALKTKYHDVVKAEEYLEKVFDINWNMPETNYPLGLVKATFPSLDSNDLNLICQMFQALQFSNARHIKKVLNKYELLRLSKVAKSDQSDMPYIIDKEGNGSLQITILALFFITLYEFRRTEFNELDDYDEKRVSYTTSVEDHLIHQGHDASRLGAHRQLVSSKIIIEQRQALTTSNLISKVISNDKSTYEQLKHATVFLPKHGLKQMSADLHEVLLQFSAEHLGVKFCRFLIRHKDKFQNMDSKYPFWRFFQMCKLYL